MGLDIVEVAPPSTPVVVRGGGGEINVAQPMGAPPPTALAPGFRFHPTDEELVRYYLRRKICGKPVRFQAVCEIDVYKSDPWELARYSSLKSRDLEWFFFSAVDKKYISGSRLNRTTGKGYWKTTGKDRCVRHKDQTIGLKKTLVFHSGRAPHGKRTNWVMHEYRLVDEELKRAGVAQDAFVLCRIFHKSGLGPPNADRYAPFLDEEWDDGATLFLPGAEAEAEDDIANGDEYMNKPLQGIPLIREKSEEPEPLCFGQTKRPRQDDQNSSQANGSEDSTTTSQKPTTMVAIGKAPGQCGHPSEPPSGIQLICNTEKSDEPEPLSLGQCKRPRKDDPSFSHANGSEDSITTTTTTSQELSSTTMMMTTDNVSSSLLGFPLLESDETKEIQQASTATFDSSSLEKSVPPGFLKFISNLENEILDVSMERETLKIEVMRGQAIINILHLRMDFLNRENEDLRRLVRGV